MNKAVNVAVVDGKTITQTVDLGAAKTGQPVRIKAVQGGKYILAEGEKGVAPENITIKRVGKNLHIALEGSDPDQPDLIIENFEGSGGQLVGIAEDGSYYPYISSDADQDRSAAFLYEGIEAPQVLGAQPLSGFGSGLVAGSGIGWFWPALLGLGALGLLGGIYAATRDSDSKKDGVTNTDKGSVGGAHDNVGDKQGAILPGESTDDRTPTFTGIGRPGTSVEIVDNGKTIGTAIVGEDGKWEFTPGEPGLSDGSHNIVIIPVDKDGNKGEPSPGHQIIVDTVAPGRPLIEGVFDNVAPVEGLIGSGGHTNDTTPTLSGTAEAGSIVRIYDNGEEIGSVLVGADGKWSFTPEEPGLAEGEHEFTLIAEDAAGNISVPSLPFPIIIDTTAPTKPGEGTGAIGDVIDDVGPIQGTIGSGDTTDDPTPTFSGDGATPGDTVVIIDNGKEIGTAIVGEDGKWTFTPEEPGLGEGAHEIVVVIRDPAGNESEPSDPPYVVIVDTTTPGKPGAGTGGIDDVLDNVGPVQGSIGNGEATDDNTPTLVGSGGKPGNTVVIIDNNTGTVIGTAIVGEDGRWEFTPQAPGLAEGTHEIVVVIRDPNGNESEPSDPHTIIVDTTAPGKPGAGTGGIELVHDNVGPDQGGIESGDSTDDKTPTFHGGGATPGDTVVIIDNATGTEIGTAIVGEDGRWEFTPPEPGLAEGSHEIVVVIRDPAGNASEPSDPWIVIVDTTAPVAPTIGSVVDDQGTVTGPIGQDGLTDDAQPLITGTAEPGSLVIIYDNGNPIGSERVGADGTWSHLPVPALVNGSHALTVTATDPAGNISAPSGEHRFELIAGGRPTAPSITGVADDVADGIGNISPDGHTNDTLPQVTGTAEPFAIIELFVNGVTAGTITADAAGNWSITPNPALTEGTNNLTVTATNAAGNTSVPSGEYPIIVDTTGPAAADGTLTDNVGAVTGPIADGDTTDDSTPTFNGTAEPNTTVIISLGNGDSYSVPVGADGRWTFTPPALTDGNYSFSTVVVDAAGNRSPSSAPINFVIDTSAVMISIDQAADNVGVIQNPVADGGVTDDTTPTLSGRGTPGGTVTIYRADGTPLPMTATVDALGNWSLEINPPLAEGSHAFTATVTTAAGGESAPTAPFRLEIDLTPSPVPVVDSITDDVGSIQGPIADGATTDDTTPTLRGRGVPGEIIIIRNNGVPIDSVTVQPDGRWTFTTPPLNDGSTNEFDVISQDAAGNQSAPSAPWTVIVDTAAPVVPTIDSLTDDFGNVIGDTTFDTTPTLAGKAEPFSIVSIYDGATLLGTTTAGEDGSWEFTTSALDFGNHELTAIATDKAGNNSPSSSSVDLTVFAIGRGSEDFNSFPFGDLPQGVPIALSNGLNMLGVGSEFSMGGGANDRRLALSGDVTVTLVLASPTDYFEIRFSAIDLYKGTLVRFLDVDGNELDVQFVPIGGGSPIVDFTPPAGVLIGSVVVETSGDGRGINIHDLKWGSDISGSNVVSDSEEQTASDQIISIANVSELEEGEVIEGGAGIDTFRITGADQVFDLTALADKVTSIEIIDITGTGNNTLNLSLSDVLEQGGKSLFTGDDVTQMMIKGNAGDVVNLDDLLPDGTDPGDWATVGTTTVAGVTYNVYQHSTLDAQLLVQDGVTTNLV